MRILFISAFYPPYIIGGWEQLVQDINQHLQKRGHITHVLTSDYGIDASNEENNVDRTLTLESDIYNYKPIRFFTHKIRLERNLKLVVSTVEKFRPDVIFIHVMWNLNKGIAWIAEQLCPGCVVYYIANNWPYAVDPHTAYWRDDGHNIIKGLGKRLISPLPLKIVEHELTKFRLKFEHVISVSQAIKNDLIKKAAIDPNNIKVIYNGVETDLFIPLPDYIKDGEMEKGLSLLYAGSLVSHKGVHTAIEAMAILANQNDSEVQNITLTIVGSGTPDYENQLRNLVSKSDLGDRVKFLGRVPRERMPELIRKYHVLVFPSTWEEPLARVMQEGMASGLVVIGTLTGGSGELLIEGQTGLTFEPFDSRTLAEKILILRRDRKLYHRLSNNGRDMVLHQFDLNRMIDEIENYFCGL